MKGLIHRLGVWLLVAGGAGGGLATTQAADVVISEIMADNASGLQDEDGDHPDWIELTNLSANDMPMAGWYLTTRTNDLRQWRFPAVTLAAGGRMIVFASNKNRRIPEEPLHTNFKLKDSGEYLALIRPDGGTVEFEFAPTYPPQFSDLSYGFPGPATMLLVTQGAPARVKTATTALDFATNFVGWSSSLTYTDSTWRAIGTGAGYENDPANSFGTWIGPNGSIQSIVSNKTGTFFMRLPFLASNVTSMAGLRLRTRHDDGFRAYLNGTEIASENAPATADWNTRATRERPEEMLAYWAVFNTTNFQALLQNGSNLLAFEAYNVLANDVDMLFLPELEATFGTELLTNQLQYLHYATPGDLNSGGSGIIGPRLWDATDDARPPPGGAGSPSIAVTVRVDKTQRNLQANGVRVAWRTMFGAETVATMTLQTSGVYTAQIPTTQLAAGQMLRWRFFAYDTGSVTSSLPPYRDPNDNDQYYGTVAWNTALTNSRLPVLHWFCANTNAANQRSGTRCSVYFLSNFYDNVFVNLHGQTSSGFPKKPYDFDFNRDNRFLWREGEGRVKDVNLLSNFGDKTKCRNQIAYETMREVGTGYHYAFPVRVEQNGAFFSVTDLVEEGDFNWLKRLGHNETDALYKVYDSLTNSANAEKKSREFEDKSDINALIAALDKTRPLSDRQRYAYDNINLPDAVSYFCGQALIHNNDHGHKNYYMFRESTGSLEWSIWPWDVDLSFGHNFGPNYYNDTIRTNNSINFIRPNTLYTMFYSSPELVQMYLRRFRTMMDRWMQPPGTTTNLYFEGRFDAVLATVAPADVVNNDAKMDFLKWGGWPAPNDTNNVEAPVETERVKAQFFPGRRAFLWNTTQVISNQYLPPSQPLHPPLIFGTYDAKPASGVADHEFFSLVNTNTYAVDISDWSVTGGVRFTFSPGTVIPPGAGTNRNIGVLFVARDRRAFRTRTASPRSNEYCFVTGPYEGQMSARGESLTLLDDTGWPIATLSWPANPTPAQSALRISEIMYNPGPPTDAERMTLPYLIDSDFEYLELVNAGTNDLDIGGCRIEEGVRFTVPAGIVLGAGARALVVANSDAFMLRHGSLDGVIGVYDGVLDDAGERLQVLDAAGEPVLDFDYDDDWYPVTDGLGFSLVIRDEKGPWDGWDLKESWRASGQLGGSAAIADPEPPVFPPAIINEALAHTDPPQFDTIELWNPSPFAAAVGGWFLSDDRSVPRKFRIPDGTTIPPWGYIFYDEGDFNPVPGSPPGFALSSTGDDVWLFSGDGQTNLTGYSYGIDFGASPNGISFGRHVNSVDEEFFVSQSAFTPGATNAYPFVGPVVVSEIMYHPAATGDSNDAARLEYIELENAGPSPTPLYDPNAASNTWRIRNAVDFDFPGGFTLPAGGRALIVGFDAAADAASLAVFRSVYGVDPAVPVLGPWSGRLDNMGEKIELFRPDAPNTNLVPYILVEAVRYRDAAPWDAGAAGTGWSLQRIDADRFGNDPANWFAAPPTAGGGTDISLDSDGDGQSDAAEWRAGTDRTNVASRLEIRHTGLGPTGVWIEWSSVPGRRYGLERADDLATSVFTAVGADIPGAAGTTTTIDTNMPAGRLFYRVVVPPP